MLTSANNTFGYTGASRRVSRLVGALLAKTGFPDNSRSMTNATISLHFARGESVNDWLAAATPMPALCEVAYFGDDNDRRPISGLMGPTQEYLAYTTTHQHSGRVYGRTVSVSYYQRPDGYGELAISNESMNGTLTNVLAYTTRLLSFFEQYHLTYAYACLDDERDYRNLFQYDLWNDGRMSEVLLGSRLSRYFPGLYWMNYFSRHIASVRQVDMSSIRSHIEGREIAFERGVGIQLYEAPEAWFDARQAVDDYLVGDSLFFSMRRIPAPPRMQPREFVDYLGKLAAEWS